jgi:hypothetical protein
MRAKRNAFLSGDWGSSGTQTLGSTLGPRLRLDVFGRGRSVSVFLSSRCRISFSRARRLLSGGR